MGLGFAIIFHGCCSVRSLTFQETPFVLLSTSAQDPFNFDADPDPDPGSALEKMDPDPGHF